MYRLGWYRELAPPPDLESIVDLPWVYGRPLRGSVPIPGDGHRVLPETGLSLCFRSRRDENGFPTDPALIVIGPVRTLRFFNPEPGFHLEAVKIKPEWSHDLLGIDPGELSDGGNDLVSVRRPRAIRLLDRLIRTRSSGEALALLLQEVRVLRAACSASRDTWLAHRGLERIRASRGATLGVDALAREIGISERHLRRVIRETTSFGPKEHHRIQRLNRAVPAAERSFPPDWAAVAADAGYYDQSHLIQDFRSLAGRPPAELLAERRIQQVMIQEPTEAPRAAGRGR